MTRIRTATIFASLALSVYFFAVSIAAVFLGRFGIAHALLTPLTLLQDLFGGSIGQFDLVRDLLSVSTLWLTFVCLIDLTMLVSSIDIRQQVRSLSAVNRYARRFSEMV